MARKPFRRRRRVAKGATSRKKSRRVRRVRSNPPGVLVSREVLGLKYKHAQSATRAAYEHPFGKGVEMWALRDGTVLLKSAYGFPLHGEFTVRDSE